MITLLSGLFALAALSWIGLGCSWAENRRLRRENARFLREAAEKYQEYAVLYDAWSNQRQIIVAMHQGYASAYRFAHRFTVVSKN